MKFLLLIWDNVRRNKTRDALEVDGDVATDVPEGNAMRDLDDGDEGGC